MVARRATVKPAFAGASRALRAALAR